MIDDDDNLRSKYERLCIEFKKFRTKYKLLKEQYSNDHELRTQLQENLQNKQSVIEKLRNDIEELKFHNDYLVKEAKLLENQLIQFNNLKKPCGTIYSVDKCVQCYNIDDNNDDDSNNNNNNNNNNNSSHHINCWSTSNKQYSDSNQELVNFTNVSQCDLKSISNINNTQSTNLKNSIIQNSISESNNSKVDLIDLDIKDEQHLPKTDSGFNLNSNLNDLSNSNDDQICDLQSNSSRSDSLSSSTPSTSHLSFITTSTANTTSTTTTMTVTTTVTTNNFSYHSDNNNTTKTTNDKSSSKHEHLDCEQLILSNNKIINELMQILSKWTQSLNTVDLRKLNEENIHEILIRRIGKLESELCEISLKYQLDHKRRLINEKRNCGLGNSNNDNLNCDVTANNVMGTDVNDEQTLSLSSLMEMRIHEAIDQALYFASRSNFLQNELESLAPWILELVQINLNQSVELLNLKQVAENTQTQLDLTKISTARQVNEMATHVVNLTDELLSLRVSNANSNSVVNNSVPMDRPNFSTMKKNGLFSVLKR